MSEDLKQHRIKWSEVKNGSHRHRLTRYDGEIDPIAVLAWNKGDLLNLFNSEVFSNLTDYDQCQLLSIALPDWKEKADSPNEVLLNEAREVVEVMHDRVFKVAIHKILGID